MKKTLFLIAFLIYFFNGCKDNTVNNDTPVLYSGNWAGLTNQTKEMEIDIEKINNVEAVKRYKIIVEFNNGSSKTTITLSKSNSDGLTTLKNNYFRIQIDEQDSTQYIDGVFSSTAALSGTFLVKTKMLSDTFYVTNIGTYTALKK